MIEADLYTTLFAQTSLLFFSILQSHCSTVDPSFSEKLEERSVHTNQEFFSHINTRRQNVHIKKEGGGGRNEFLYLPEGLSACRRSSILLFFFFLHANLLFCYLLRGGLFVFDSPCCSRDFYNLLDNKRSPSGESLNLWAIYVFRDCSPWQASPPPFPSLCSNLFLAPPPFLLS